MVRTILAVLYRWYWLFIITTAVAALGSYFYFSAQPTNYRAKALLLVGPSISSSNPELRDLQAAGQLLETYAAIVTTRPFLQETIDTLNIDTSPSVLENQIEIVTTPETQILDLRVFDPDPDRAVRITETIVQQLLEVSPSIEASPSTDGETEDGEDPTSDSQINQQIARMEERIAESEGLVQQLENSLQSARTPEERNAILNDILQESNRQADAEQFLTSLYAIRDEPLINQIMVLEAPDEAKKVDTQLPFKLIISAAAGLIIGIVGAVGIEYLSNTINTIDELVQSTELPVLGSIIQSRKVKPGNEQLVTRSLASKSIEISKNGNNKPVENYRRLAVRILYALGVYSKASAKPKCRAVMVVSPQKTGIANEIAANLGVVLSLMDRKVLLLDCNLDNPSFDRMFEVEATPGLSDAVVRQHTNVQTRSVKGLPNLQILTRGSTPTNSFDILASGFMKAILDHLKERFDIIVMSSPPLESAAAEVLSAESHASIIPVVSGRTSQSDVVSGANNLGNTIGTIFVGPAVFAGTPHAASQRQTLPTDPIAAFDRWVQETDMVDNVIMPLEGIDNSDDAFIYEPEQSVVDTQSIQTIDIAQLRKSQEEVALDLSGIEIVDMRYTVSMTAALRDIRTVEADVLVWAEGFRTSSSPGLTLLELRPAESLVVLTAPTDLARLRTALSIVKPSRLYWVIGAPPIRTLREFLSIQRLLCNKVIERNNGQVEISRLIERLAQPENVVLAGLDYFNAMEMFSISHEEHIVYVAEGSGNRSQSESQQRELEQAIARLRHEWLQADIFRRELRLMRPEDALASLSSKISRNDSR